MDMVQQKTKQEWIDLLETAGVPCGPINTLDEVFDNPQVLARDMLVELPHPSAGKVKLVGSPMKMSATPAQALSAPPLLGQHTDEVLRDLLGYGDARLAELKRSQVI
ncbi:CoA transferase, partial [Undibacterium sp.]|uniref:CoA transferase n=1 Tax=Undibacterium sp. TaxID=1914977 RepID=UPI002B757CB0